MDLRKDCFLYTVFEIGFIMFHLAAKVKHFLLDILNAFYTMTGERKKMTEETPLPKTEPVVENLDFARLIFKEEMKYGKKEKIKNPWTDYFYNEKILHSEDVLSAAQWILKNASFPVTAQQKDEYLFAALLHDIGRFEEIARLSKDRSQHTDHGLYTAERLRLRGLDDEALILALEHHGHVESAYFNDPRVQSLPPEQKKRSEKIYHFVRDVDRIGNFYRWCLSPEILENIDGMVSVHRHAVSEDVLDDVLHTRSVDYKKIRSFEDRLVAITSWVFSIQLKESFDYIHHFKAMRGMFHLMEKHIDDRATVSMIEEKVTDFIQSRSVK